MIKSEVESITPKKAEEYLRKYNTNNYRPLKRHIYKPYAEDMRNGRWQLNGESIVFGKDGTLKDGQNRLAAIIESGVTVDILVVRDVDDDVCIYDSGVNRTLPQITNAMKIDCNPTITAAANIIVGNFRRERKNTQVIEYIKDNIDELNRAYRVVCYGNNKLCKNAPCVTAAYLVLRTGTIPTYEVELFFRLFNDWGATSADGYEISPAVIARRMFDDRGDRSGYQIQKEKMEILTLALNDFHQGKKRELKYKLSEPFKFRALLDKVRKADGLED